MAHHSLFQNTVSTLAALFLGVGIVVSTGILFGQYSQRWGPPVQLVEAGNHLDSMPSQIGPWRLTEEMEMREAVLSELECAGYVNRRYINQETGDSINVALIVGPPGPIAVHTPEICYSSRAYEIQTERKATSLKNKHGESDTFWTVDFKSRDMMSAQLRVCYAWSRGQRWEASSAPRYEYAAAPLLYKIQLAGSMEAGSGNGDPDPCRQFLAEFVNADWSLTRPTPPPQQENTSL